MQFPKDLILAFKKLFTAAEDFFAPFAKQFADQLFNQIVGMAIVAISHVSKDPTILTNADARNAALNKLKDQAIAAGIQASETALLNALQAAYTHLNPDKVTITQA